MTATLRAMALLGLSVAATGSLVACDRGALIDDDARSSDPDGTLVDGDEDRDAPDREDDDDRDDDDRDDDDRDDDDRDDDDRDDDDRDDEPYPGDPADAQCWQTDDGCETCVFPDGTHWSSCDEVPPEEECFAAYEWCMSVSFNPDACEAELDRCLNGEPDDDQYCWTDESGCTTCVTAWGDLTSDCPDQQCWTDDDGCTTCVTPSGELVQDCQPYPEDCYQTPDGCLVCVGPDGQERSDCDDPTYPPEEQCHRDFETCLDSGIAPERCEMRLMECMDALNEVRCWDDPATGCTTCETAWGESWRECPDDPDQPIECWDDRNGCVTCVYPNGEATTDCPDQPVECWEDDRGCVTCIEADGQAVTECPDEPPMDCWTDASGCTLCMSPGGQPVIDCPDDEPEHATCDTLYADCLDLGVSERVCEQALRECLVNNG